MQDFSASPREMVASFWRNRSLIYVLSRREILGCYRGSYFGILWSFFNPLVMLVVYTFVFSQIFQSRWTPHGNSKVEFALVLFAGLIIFNIFSECLTQAPKLILNNINYVKKVAFPLEILPWITLYAALFHGCLSFLVWIMAYGLFFGAPHLTIIYIPLIILPFCLMVLGLSWILSSLGVYIRDIGQFIGIVISALMFTAPIFYPLTSLSEEYQRYIYLNPLTVPVQIIRDYIFWGLEPDTSLRLLITYWAVSLMTVWFGFFWFQKTRKGFADAL